MPKKFLPHPAAEIFPIDEDAISTLADDIRQNGQHFPIELYEGKVIDGRRRLLACRQARIVPEFTDIKTDDPVAYVLSLNLHRRHLTPSQ
ncbi:MAG: ParB N-terminal domain-containing protein, partial [Planctomycetales bacterium]|nr:ParB N-terminal domain-containing protein [Planctomycetales bacterium]